MISGIGNGISQSGVVQSNNIKQNAQKETVSKTEKIDRVEEIKKQIEAGTYKINIQKSAEAMADTLM
jgi:anti-sigma28 factor (negative regulator of flagellin synthesis)